MRHFLKLYPSSTPEALAEVGLLAVFNNRTAIAFPAKESSGWIAFK
ncbi:MAG: hypothetical protein K0Q79_510 [Flavipsychrobacter sp.]|nr:hypothetical protein [Flavipsychrobacter sp.]